MPKKSKHCKPATTELNANPWELSDGSQTNVARWQDLDWSNSMEPDAVTASQPADILHSKIYSEMRLGKRLGKGGNGVAYVCRFPTLQHLVGGTMALTIKLPLPLMACNVLDVLADGSITRRDALSPKEIDAEEISTRDLRDDFSTYEKIMEPPSFFKRFKYGQLADNVTPAQHAAWMADEVNTFPPHPGMAHIHHIVHFDESVPCIFSEQCNGTVGELRKKRPSLFEATPNMMGGFSMSDEWCKVGLQTAQALAFMMSKDVVHLDLKPNNVFYRCLGHNNYHYLVSDFGIALPDKLDRQNFVETTHYYMPKAWPYKPKGRVARMPSTLMTYTFAMLMAACLKVPGVDNFPAPIDLDTFKTFGDEIKHIASNGPAMMASFFPLSGPVPPQLEAAFPEWYAIIPILRWSYDVTNCHVDNYFLLEKFLEELQLARS